MNPDVTAFFDAATNTVTYLVAEPGGPAAAVIDPVLDFDAKSGRTATEGVERIVAEVQRRSLRVEWILETHVHADHLSAAPVLRHALGGRTGIGSGIAAVQRTFKALYNLGDDFATDGSQFDRLFADGDSFPIGALAATVLHTPGHTPACVSYRIGDACFVGDTVFMPDFGTARCDFPGGDARLLYRSVRRLLALPPETRLFTGHDYGPGGRAFRWESTVAEQRADNVHVAEDTDEDTFVALRSRRDATLAMPALLLPAVQVNIRGGRLPPPESNGVSYLKLPLNAL